MAPKKQTRRPAASKSKSKEAKGTKETVPKNAAFSLGALTTTRTGTATGDDWTGFTIHEPGTRVKTLSTGTAKKGTSADALAREALKSGTLQDIQNSIQKGINEVISRIEQATGRSIEPTYLKKDEETIHKILRLKKSIKRFSWEFFGFEANNRKRDRRDALKKVLQNANAPLGMAVADIAASGPTGKDGWIDMLMKPHQRTAIVRAVVARIILEHVLKNPGFGCTTGQKIELRVEDVKMVDSEGFSRKMKRRKMLERYIGDRAEPEDFEGEIGRLTIDLYATISPLLKLDENYGGTIPILTGDWFENSQEYHRENQAASRGDMAVINRLFDIVTQAARLGLAMHTDPEDVVYIFRDPFIDDPFDASTTTMTNLLEMGQNDPHKSGKVLRPEPQRLVQFTIFPEVTAYRRGGFKGADFDQGFRVRQLTKAYAQFRWGRPMYDPATGEQQEGHLLLANPQVLSEGPMSTESGCDFM